MKLTQKALIQRINRKLKPEWKQLRTARGVRLEQNVGHYYVLDTHRNAVVDTFVDPVAYGRSLGVLHQGEKVQA